MENNEKSDKRIGEMQKSLNYNDSIWHRFKRHVKVWLTRRSLMNRLVTILICIGVACGLLTYASLINIPPFGDSSSALIVLLNINLVILLALVVLVSRRIIALYVRRKRGIVGSNLHIRLVFIFSLLAALPAMVMAVFSVGFFYFGLHGWLDDRVRTAINESQAVAEAYLMEHKQLIRADVLGMVADLDREASLLAFNPEAMNKMLQTQSFLRNFSNIHIVLSDGSVSAQANLDVNFVADDVVKQIKNKDSPDDVYIQEQGQQGITALVKLDNYLNAYAYVERDIDPKVLGHVERTREGVAQYQDIEKSSTRLQIILTAIYLLITMLLTIAATWFGLSFARRLMTPITELITASEQASSGDLSVRVDPSYAVDEFKMLGHAFNRMTETIENQQGDLVDANTQMDFRRRFTETILGGVSTGVLSVDDDKKITLANNAAGELLYIPIEGLVGQKITYIMPELSTYLEEAFEQNDFGAVKTCEIQVRRQDKAIRVFIARIVVERLDNNQKGAIVTFDDLTSVLANQRKAAWADIARRIAHEIKNPLTPIQLSAERLNRKYRKMLDEKDQAVFDQCTDTIIRHVGDIKTMVNSFSEFAKMPEANIQNDNIFPVLEEVFTLNKQAQSDVEFNFISNIEDARKIIVPYDAQQIRQSVTNLVKNAVEAMQDANIKNKAITFILAEEKNRVIIGIADNGPGLPDNVENDKLSEPYVTHKEKGTGLGLAIVKKIVEDHHGDLMFNPNISIIKDMNISYSTLIAFSIAKDET